MIGNQILLGYLVCQVVCKHCPSFHNGDVLKDSNRHLERKIAIFHEVAETIKSFPVGLILIQQLLIGLSLEYDVQ